MRRLIDIVCLTLFVLSIASAAQALAQEYPVRPIRLVITTGPGGANDIIGRLVAAKLTERLGQQVIVDNRAGANGIIGTQLAAKSPADGYTLLLGSFSNLAVNMSLYSSVPYDPVKDFQPVTLIARVPQVLTVHPAVSARSVKDLVSLAKQKPKGLTYGSGGAGSGAHLSAELFKWLAKVDIVEVPYKAGLGAAMIDVIGGQISILFVGVPGAAPHIESGKLRALGVTGSKRIQALPNLPTIEEAGVPGYELTLWYGLLTRAGTPAPIVKKLNESLVAAVQTPDSVERFTALGGEVTPSTPAEFSKLIQSEIKKWGTLIKAAGIKAE